eukprot:4113756-Amphidinium_carterae.1
MALNHFSLKTTILRFAKRGEVDSAEIEEADQLLRLKARVNLLKMQDVARPLSCRLYAVDLGLNTMLQ